jgi:hypothetical protein
MLFFFIYLSCILTTSKDKRYEVFEDTKVEIIICNSKISGETTQWSEEKGRKDKQRSTNHYPEILRFLLLDFLQQDKH